MLPRRWKGLLSLGALGLASAGLLTATLAPGCKFVESTADTLAAATSGTAVSGVFGGIARTAESMKDYSPSQEHFIGRSVAAEVLSQYKVHPDKALQDYVNVVGAAVLVAPEAKKTFAGYHFVVLEGEQLQAVSTPGGFVFLTEGTVRRAKDEDELAAVLAHEVAHVTLGHGIGAIKAATRKQAFGLLAQGAGQIAVESSQAGGGAQQKQFAELVSTFGNTVQDITTSLLVQGYSRDLELEADKLATTLLQSSGYARSALATYLRGVAKEGAGGKGGWMATHPSPDDRVAELGELATGASPARPVRRERFAKALGGG